MFTHKGKKLKHLDDFKDEIPPSSDDDDDDRGNLKDEYVQNLHFGGGEEDEKPEEEGERKSKKEIYDEIMAKSKAHKLMKSEIKMAGEQLRE